MKAIPWMVLLTLTSGCTLILKSPAELNMKPKTVILTFDDGPYERMETDMRLLDVLKKQQVRAYFCLIGRKLKGKEDWIRRLDAEGHVIAFHTANHESLIFKSYPELEKALLAFDGDISRILGKPFRALHIRPPVGMIGSGLAGKLSEQGYRLLPVTHNPSDTFVGKNESRNYIQGLIRKIQADQGGIIVLHNGVELFPQPGKEDFFREGNAANRDWLPDEVDRLIGELKSAGYDFILE